MNTDSAITSDLFELLTKATRDAVWNWDLEANTVWWNEGYTSLFGHDSSQREKGPESWYDHIHPDDKDFVLSSIHDVIDRGGVNWSAEYRFGRADGTYATVYDRGYILHRDDKAVRMVGAMQDISERVALQKAREESDDRLRFALQSAQLGTWDVDPIRGIVNWDDRCRQLFGLTKHNTIAYNDTFQYIHHDDRRRVEEAMQWALNPASGGYYQCTYRMIGGDDGKLRWIRSMGQTHFNETGQAYRFSGVAQDITEEVTAREKSDLSEQRARLALQGSGAGSFLIDLATNEILYSPTFSRILTGESVIGLGRDVFINHVHPDDRRIREQAYETGAHNGTISYEVRFVWKDQSIHWVKVLGQYIFDTNGKAISFSGIALDVTGQKEKSRALKEAEGRFSIAFANTSVGMAFTDPQANFSMVNEAYTKLLGYSSEELSHLNSIQLTHPDDRVYNRQLFDEVAQGKRPFFNLVKRYVCKDNSFRWVQMNVTRLVDAQDVSQSMVIIAYDITEAVEAEAKLRASEERFRNMVTQAPVAIGVLNGRNMTVETANTSMLEIWGKDASIVGLPIAEALPEIRGQGFIDLLEKVYDSGISHYGYETLAQLHRKGQLEDAYFNFVYAPVRDDGTITGVIVIATEVTAQVKAKQALQASEQRFRDLISDAPVATTLYIGRELIVEMPNEAMLRLWGKDSSVNGKPLALALPELAGQPFLEILDEVYTTGIAYHTQELKADLVVDGVLGSYYFNFSYKPLRNSEGDVYAILNMAVDVTEQVLIRKEIEELVASQEKQIQARTEQLMTSNQDLRRSNENLEKFAYIASHDLQEPLRKIQSFGDILKSQYGEQLGVGIEFLDRMQTSASRMSLLIKDLLAFSRISTRQERVTDVVLNSIIADVLDDLEVTIRQADAQLEIDTLPTILGDTSQLRQLFQNLLSNALKFRQVGVKPVIQIRYETVVASELPDSVEPTQLAAKYHCISVSDNGIGFDVKYVDRIFQVFQRLHNRNEYAGTGIGLAICEKVAANHGGAITASSQPGQGATFMIYLPAD
ncbi:PAS domain-containing sensor histidine kinase [Spirosoma sp.]|uniref:PAS domain-containing sensor histidine kinase n=1 Tax=Spirosoma sp. TaxID=1899569 RepID=UPI003B3AD58F